MSVCRCRCMARWCSYARRLASLARTRMHNTPALVCMHPHPGLHAHTHAHAHMHALTPSLAHAYFCSHAHMRVHACTLYAHTLTPSHAYMHAPSLANKCVCLGCKHATVATHACTHAHTCTHACTHACTHWHACMCAAAHSHLQLRHVSSVGRQYSFENSSYVGTIGSQAPPTSFTALHCTTCIIPHQPC